MRLVSRIATVCAIAGLEFIGLTIWLDTQALAGQHGVLGAIGDWGPILARGCAVFAIALLALGWSRSRSGSEDLFRNLDRLTLSWRALSAHAATMVAFCALSAVVFGKAGPGHAGDGLAIVWVLAGILSFASLGAAAVPIGQWSALTRWGGRVWAYAWGIVVAVSASASLGGLLWKPASKLTFACVELILRPLVSGFTSDPSLLTIGTTRFMVSISPTCSGLEGAALMLVFGMGWLACFRKEYRFPHALVLLPAGVSAVWVLNCFRVAGLILIGNAGAAEIAMGGFHSHAGWIGFNVVAVTSAVASSRVGWISRRSGRRPVERNPVSPYLAPLLAILAAGMISGAMSTGAFEQFYALRLLAAAAVLWWFRREYAVESWRPGWRAAASGAAVFLLWLGAERIWPAAGGSAIPAQLASMDMAARTGWLITRALAAVITVPLAEELAFRGFLLRRLASPTFEAVDPRRVGWHALVLSSLLFGVLHGSRWIVGTAAGAAYALAYRRGGSIADAVAAHATTNALLAIWVVARGEWGLW